MKKIDLSKNKRKDSTEHHKDMLGMDIPSNYFKTSKSKIIEKVSIAPKEKPNVFYLRPAFRYAIAATVVLLIGLGILFKFITDTNFDASFENIENLEFTNLPDDDLLINFIFINDEDTELFLDRFLVESVLLKAELNEQIFDDVFMNSILVKDSFIDNYIDDQFIENIIL